MDSITLEDLGGSTPLADTPETLPSNHYSAGTTSGIEERALQLLGAGVGQEAVASALGVSSSRISQLLSQEEFANKVAKLRYEHLQKHTQRDEEYDKVEDQLLTKLNKSLPLLVKPQDILKAIQIVNGAKRRGQDNPAAATTTSNIVNLILPNVVTEKFTVNIDNQVTKAGDQNLHTMASGNLLRQVEEANEVRALSHEE